VEPAITTLAWVCGIMPKRKKIGSYYSTPIFSFRCKCHLCDGWFEIHTDPKNTRYVVAAGARKKEEDWDPEENGGFAIHDSEGNAGPVDPLAALEKTTDAQNHLTSVSVPRLESLQTMSEHYNSDPYALSLKVRKRFREEKKVEKQKKSVDDQIKGRYGLPETLSLLEDDDKTAEEAKQEWARGRREQQLHESNKRQKLAVDITTIPRSTSSSLKPLHHSKPSSMNPISSLRARILENTAQRSNPSRQKPPNSKTGIILRR